jgi:hypothetical protein
VTPIITGLAEAFHFPSPAPKTPTVQETTHGNNILGPEPLRRSSRIRQPTQAAIESQQTESFYRRKPQQVRRREGREALKDNSSRAAGEHKGCLIHDTARLTVAAELVLGGLDEFARQASDKKFDSQFPFCEPMRRPSTTLYTGREAIHVEISALIQFVCPTTKGPLSCNL